jgi:hypothetical protein
MRLNSIPTLVGLYLFTLSSALAQTTAPSTPSPAPTTAEGGMANWWWIILIVVLAAIAIWYYMSRKRP